MHKIILAGESSVLIYFGDKIDASLPKNIANFANKIKKQFSEIVIDLIPSYTSLLIHYDLNKIGFLEFSDQLENFIGHYQEQVQEYSGNTIHIPVYYGLDSGLDLERLLAEKNLTLDEFIEIHSVQNYLVYAIGFAPNFAFLGEVDERIQAPRLETPRIKIPAGSVGIADSQTAVYPSESSGGWSIIGRTLLDLSISNPENTGRFKVGDCIKFYAITRDEYLKNGGRL